MTYSVIDKDGRTYCETPFEGLAHLVSAQTDGSAVRTYVDECISCGADTRTGYQWEGHCVACAAEHFPELAQPEETP